MSLFSSNKIFIGIDIGNAGIKLVELKKEKGTLRLLSYGFTENVNSLVKKGGWTKDNASVDYAAQVINLLCKKINIIGKDVITSLPNFSVFSSVIKLSNVKKKDIEAAVHWEAKKVIPLKLEEMVLDWKEISKVEDGNQNKENYINILLTGAPKILVNKYIDIFKQTKVNLISLETEIFSLIRSLLGNDKTPSMIVEIGATTTNISAVVQGMPTINRSIDVGGLTITKAICNDLGVDEEKAEQLKFDLGIASMDPNDINNNNIPKTIINSIAPIVNEIKYVLNLFENKNKTKIKKIILSGGSSLLGNLSDYLTKTFDINVVVGDPWARVSYPLDLEPILSVVGPRLSVAIGLAMRNE